MGFITITRALWNSINCNAGRTLEISIDQRVWLYDGDGKRVAEINADGTATIFIGNYFEGAYPEPEPPAQPPQPPQPNKVYLPIVLKGGVSFEPITARMGTLYFYADGQRIAMKKDGAVYYLYGDQLGGVSAVADGSGAMITASGKP